VFGKNPRLFILLAVLAAGTPARAVAPASVEEEVRLLRDQNALLQQTVRKQGSSLDTLTKKVQQLESASQARAVAEGENSPPTKGGFNIGKVNLGAEGGVGFFSTGSEGFAPHSEFRVDEARVFLEAPVWDSVYFFGTIELATRENTGLNTRLGELYLDFEDVSQLWGKEHQLNVRAGRIQIPFGEEYQNRYAMENPLISHSLSDIWGIDPGIELYGALGKFSYAVAVQNGGVSGVQDFDGDKSVAGRISYDPNAHWHFSVSGMRTGDLDANNDYLSAVWFANGWFSSIGSPATTKFHADLVEADLTARWNGGHVGLFGGYARYGDNDPAGNNSRNIFYYSIEAQQRLSKKFYVAARFSQIFAENGYPVVGLGNYDNYAYAGTSEIWRASLGVGYRFSNNLGLKAEYSVERGRQPGGGSRDNEDFFGTEAVFKF
jgi:hypothetical protein